MPEARKVVVHDPFNGELLGEVPFATADKIAQLLDRAGTAFKTWRHSHSFERAQLLERAASRLEAEKADFIELIRREAGKPVSYATGEVARALNVLRWAAAETQRFAGELLRTDTTPTGRVGFGIHSRFPRGVVLGITPFNFPLNLVAHKVAPAVACGCPILIKPSPFTPLTAIRFAKLFESVPGLLQVVMADDEATAGLTRAPEIKTLSFTGSARVGWMIRRQAPEKPTTLELGGNAWVVVSEDTPAELFSGIARRIAGAAYGYAGQSCISVQNVAVHASLRDRFAEALREATYKTPYGDTRDPSVISGPVISAQAANRIRSRIQGIDQSSIQLSGCPIGTEDDSSARGTLITPTLVTVDSDNSLTLSPTTVNDLIQEEIFAPIMTLSGYDSVDDLVHRINSSPYGLQAGIYTQHLPTIEKLYRELEIGGLVVNDVPTTRHDHQPYGGVKDSGQGREGIRYAMEEMTEAKFLSLSSVVPL